MTTPIYVVSGFLGSGKTTFLSKILSSYQKEVLIIQFEDGEEELDTNLTNTGGLHLMCWTKEELEKDYEHVISEITKEIEAHEYHEIWVEWNGMEAFSKLERIFLQLRMLPYSYIEKVIYLADVQQAEILLGQTGEGPMSQVASSDIVFVRNEKNIKDINKFKQKLKSISSSLDIRLLPQESIEKEAIKRKFNPNIIWAEIILLAGVLFFFMLPFLEQRGIPVNAVLTMFMGVFLQGVPFLLLGVLLSAAIQIFVPKEWIEKVFPKSPVLGMAAGLAAGFFLPVCDCASIPVFKSLLKKGVALPAAVCFMTASPIVNPVVLISTYYAFNNDIRAVFYRTGLGLICSFLIGLSFLIKKPADFLKEGTETFSYCTCGCYEESETGKGIWGKSQLFLRHAQLEFYDVGKYLLIGIFISSLFQTANLAGLKNLGNSSMPIALFAMILLSFLLSLCSSSDAVVARSLSGTFSFVPMLGFLVFGPMMDIKNVMMLKGYFKGKFVLRLAVTALLVCYAAVLIFGLLGGGMVI
ncbi:hypothetical protein SAMN05216529_104278 [Faecalicatena contorta]|uniref:CobW/HypB/UreG nucleotide-binding domain-containing protein n=2 Tax=Faecalicatena contorta TaxID=39482 RepID=A0A315ZY06_9FIRM|nr:hypothetical protein A8805_104278 [Faecalicatena contorta]SUQ13964.1 hypothetical protein SAMN05216529_104278 [Faecalicatena contorta]